MALRLKRAAVESCRIFQTRSLSHVAAMPTPLNSAIDRTISMPPLISPEFDQNQNQPGSIDEKSFGFGLPDFGFGGSIELMAVPKKKVWELSQSLNRFQGLSRVLDQSSWFLEVCIL